MNQTRSFLLIAWLVVATLLWMEWSKSQLAEPAATDPSPTAAPAAANGAAPAAAAVPGLAPPGAAAALPAATDTALPAASAPAANAGASRPITIASDTLSLTVALQGGRIIDSQLLHYTLEKKPGSPNVHLLSSDPARYEFAEAGLIRVAADA